MKKTRRNHSSSFKAKVALTALRGDKTLIEIAEYYQIHPTQVMEWKKQLQTQALSVFDGGSARSKSGNEPDVKVLHAKIGQQALEIDFLSGALTKVGLLSAKR